MNGSRKRWSDAVRAAVAALSAMALLATGIGCGPTETRQLTIVLVEYEGPEAADSAHRVAKELTDQNLPDVFVVEGPDYGAVCVGRYPTWKDPEARQMLARVRQIRDARGQYPFAGVLLMPVPEPAPKTPWPLQKAPGLYSLYVAGWEAPGRKAAAQAYAETLRRKGYEAYVYHGPRLSMVTLGAFGPEAFDIPSQIGRPGAKPKIVAPEVLRLIQDFPRLRLEGEETPLPSFPVKVPGREPSMVAAPVIPEALYQVVLELVSTETGLVEGRRRTSGVTHAEGEIPALVTAMTGQLLDALKGEKAVRIGVVGARVIGAEKPDAASAERLDRLVAESAVAALRQAPEERSVTVLDAETTRQMLDAAGLSDQQILNTPRRAKGLKEMDYLLVGTVTVVRI